MLKTNEKLTIDKTCREFGIAPELIEPSSKSVRLNKLRAALERQDVPFPVGPAIAKAYLGLAERNVPFGVGSLTELDVDLESFKNEQVYEDLTWKDHLSWAHLVKSQQEQKHRYACREYLDGEKKFEIRGTTIPDYYLLNARIYQQTGWQLATVSEIIPAEVFFHCHSRKFFPVTTFMRPPGTDYLEEPDIGHDVAGHVATFTIPQVARVMNNHGLANNLIHQEKNAKLLVAGSDEEKRRIKEEADELLLYAGRLYWFTVEFGLVMQAGGLKAFGAGVLSSPGETRFSVDSVDSNRVAIDLRNDRDLLRLATTDYLISEFQKTYFVMKDFESLDSLTPERILKVVHTAKNLPHHTWRELVPGDEVINVGTTVTSPNEKYFRLVAKQPLDDCLYRAAIRNLRMFQQGLNPVDASEVEFVKALPEIPSWILEQFSAGDQRGMFAFPK